MHEVNLVWGMLLMGGFLPLYRAWRQNAGSTLRHALVWAGLAWGMWSLAVLTRSTALVYLALCLNACAGVAVLGARRPGVVAWNFVVLGLLAALLRPFLEGFGQLRLETAHIVFLGIALTVALGNYLPTRMALAVVIAAVGCAGELYHLAQEEESAGYVVLLILVPWSAWLTSRRPPLDAFSALWLSFRDRFGFLWAQRVREQFNRAAENASLPVVLRWGGLDAPPGADLTRACELLRAVLRRFGND